MKKAKAESARGFTIVELLIVIVIIAILAVIGILSYNGIQTRAKNTKTINATTAWIKALKLYHAQEGSWPTTNSCFGAPTTYSGSGGSCFTSSTWVVNPTFMNQVQPFINGTPEPDVTDIASGGSGAPKRGSFYQANGSGSNQYIWMMQQGVSTCPDIGIKYWSSANEVNGISCTYQLNS